MAWQVGSSKNVCSLEGVTVDRYTNTPKGMIFLKANAGCLYTALR